MWRLKDCYDTSENDISLDEKTANAMGLSIEIYKHECDLLAQQGLQYHVEMFMDEAHQSDLTNMKDGKLKTDENGEIINRKTFKSANNKLALRIAKGEVKSEV